MNATCPVMSLFGQPPHLAFANHVPCLDTLNRAPRRVKCPEALHRSDSVFDAPVVLLYEVLLYYVIEKANRSIAAAPTEFTAPLQLRNF